MTTSIATSLARPMVWFWYRTEYSEWIVCHSVTVYGSELTKSRASFVFAWSSLSIRDIFVVLVRKYLLVRRKSQYFHYQLFDKMNCWSSLEFPVSWNNNRSWLISSLTIVMNDLLVVFGMSRCTTSWVVSSLILCMYVQRESRDSSYQPIKLRF